MPSTVARRLFATVLALAALGAPAAARAQQFTISPDIECSLDGGFSFVGAYNFASGEDCGAAFDGEEDAFDTFGHPVGHRRLQVTRRSEVFTDRNLYRFLDTYTNTSNRTVNVLVGLSGELGSDSDSQIRRFADDYLITADDDPFTDEDSDYGNDPVLAFVFGNNALSRRSFSGDLTQVDETDELFLGGTLSFAPGQTRSLLFYVFLAYDESRESAADQLADEELAIRRAEELAANPFVEGLSDAERAQVANFDLAVAAVPEPGTWALVGTGLAAVAGAARRRRAAGSRAGRT